MGESKYQPASYFSGASNCNLVGVQLVLLLLDAVLKLPGRNWVGVAANVFQHEFSRLQAFKAALVLEHYADYGLYRFGHILGYWFLSKQVMGMRSRGFQSIILLRL